MRTIPDPPSPDKLWDRPAKDLRGAFANENLRAALSRCQSPYRHWDKVRYIAREENVEPELLWALVKMARTGNLRTLPFRDKIGQVLKFNLTDEVLREQSACDRQLAGTIGFGDGVEISTERRDAFILSSLMEEAIASSKLEGASTVHRVAKEMLRQKREPRDRSEQMIANNYKAIHFVRNHAESALTPEMLLEIQRTLTEKTVPDDQCGRFRTEHDHVVVEDQYDEVLHVPPHAAELPGRLGVLCDFANKYTGDFSPFLHPFVRAATIHFQIAYDHPFCDGNGRTARTLFYWSMLRSGYWLMEFLPISKLIHRASSQYGRVFQYVETDEYDLTYFLDYHARIVRLARADLQTFLERKQKETRTARKVFAAESLNDRQRKLLVHALDHPHSEYSIESHQVKHGVSYYTARADLLNLESLGFMSKRRSGKKFVFAPTDKVRERVDRSR